MHFKIASISLISKLLQTEGFGKWDGLTTFYREERIRFKNFSVYPGKIKKNKIISLETTWQFLIGKIFSHLSLFAGVFHSF